MKVCTKCKNSRELDDFYKDKNAKGGIRAVCKFCDRKKASLWNQVNAEKHMYHQKKWRTENRDESRVQAKNYLKTDKGQQTAAKWREDNKEHMQQYYRDMYSRRYNNDPMFRLRRMTSCSLYKAITRRGYKKESKTAEMLGCPWEEFKRYLESLFQPGMSWDNVGEW